MDIVKNIREHVQLSVNFNDLERFLSILNTIEEYVKVLQSTVEIKVRPCINLEGFDGVGKTTVSREIARALGDRAVAFPCIPRSLSCFRSYFDEQDEFIRRQFYYLCNIVTSYNMLNTSNESIVILDRYWPSTIVYKLAHQPDSVSIDKDLEWPSYLIQPSHIFYLSVDEKERCRRINQRSSEQSITTEEIELQSNINFRTRLETIYLRIPNIRVVNANDTTCNVTRTIIELFRKTNEFNS